MTPELVLWRVRLLTGEKVDVVEYDGWPELLASVAANPRTWMQLPNGLIINPAAVALIEPVIPGG